MYLIHQKHLLSVLYVISSVLYVPLNDRKMSCSTHFLFPFLTLSGTTLPNLDRKSGKRVQINYFYSDSQKVHLDFLEGKVDLLPT